MRLSTPLRLSSVSLDLSLLRPVSALLLQPQAGNKEEQQCGLDCCQHPWCSGVLKHRGVALSARPQAPCAHTAQRKHMASGPVHCSLTITTPKLYRLQSTSACVSHLTFREPCKTSISTPTLEYQYLHFADEESKALSRDNLSK